MADDGAGPAVVARLLELGLPDGARAVECASDSLVLPSLWEGEERVWIVDAIVRGAAPGTIHRLGHDELLGISQRHGTVHHLSLPESLRWIFIAYPEMARVRYRLWGIEPARVNAEEEGLAPDVARATRGLAEELLGALTSLS